MKTLWIVLVTVIVAGGLTAEGTYYYLNKKVTDDKKVLQTQIDKLNKDITTLNSQLFSVTTGNTATTKSTISGSVATTGSTAIANTSATVGWKTYTNADYGFSFKYPATWSIAFDNTPKPGVVDNTAKDNLSITGPDKEMFGLWVNPGGFGLESASDFYTATIKNGKITVTKKERSNGEIDPYLGQAAIGSMSYLGTDYTIAYNFDIANRSSELQTFDLILSTFQFTK